MERGKLFWQRILQKVLSRFQMWSTWLTFFCRRSFIMTQSAKVNHCSCSGARKLQQPRERAEQVEWPMVWSSDWSMRSSTIKAFQSTRNLRCNAAHSKSLSYKLNSGTNTNLMKSSAVPYNLLNWEIYLMRWKIYSRLVHWPSLRQLLTELTVRQASKRIQ